MPNGLYLSFAVKASSSLPLDGYSFIRCPPPGRQVEGSIASPHLIETHINQSRPGKLIISVSYFSARSIIWLWVTVAGYDCPETIRNVLIVGHGTPASSLISCTDLPSSIDVQTRERISGLQARVLAGCVTTRKCSQPYQEPTVK